MTIKNQLITMPVVAIVSYDIETKHGRMRTVWGLAYRTQGKPGKPSGTAQISYKVAHWLVVSGTLPLPKRSRDWQPQPLWRAKQPLPLEISFSKRALKALGWLPKP